MATIPSYIINHPSTFGLVPDALLYIVVDFDIPTKVCSTENAESLVLTCLETILFEPSYLSLVNKDQFDALDLKIALYCAGFDLQS